MAPKCRRVAVLGAGVGGLAAIKSCLEEGMEVVAYESRSRVGGVWSGEKDEWSATGPSMYRSLLSNTSKSMTCFSDFPCPASYPPYLPYNLFQEYLCMYAKHFRLLEHIRFNTRVLRVMRTEDHDSTGRWRLTLRSTTRPQTGANSTGGGEDDGRDNVWEEEFDGVMVAAGFYTKAKSPDYPGLHTSFTGKVLHSFSFTDGEAFRDKTVLVVGSANSAFDIAVEASNYAKQVYLSIGDGIYLQARVDPATGLPADLGLRRCFNAWLSPSLIMSIIGWLSQKRCNHRTLGLQFTGSGPWVLVLNDDIQQRILAGKVKILGHLSEFKGSEIITADGRVFKGIDEVVFATGYDRDLSVLDDSLGLGGEKLELYKQVFPIHEKHHTLAVVGCIRLAGPMPPAIELQARMAAYTLSGRLKLPALDVMQADSDRYNRIASRPNGRYKYAFLSLMVYEELAAEIGATPSFWRLLFSGRPKLAFKTFFGPAFPHIYRLTGPGAWQGAESAIDRAVEENRLPMRNRTLFEHSHTGNVFQALNLFKILFVFALLGITGYWVHSLVLS